MEDEADNLQDHMDHLRYGNDFFDACYSRYGVVPFGRLHIVQVRGKYSTGLEFVAYRSVGRRVLGLKLIATPCDMSVSLDY
jgi:hypothetical protein